MVYGRVSRGDHFTMAVHYGIYFFQIPETKPVPKSFYINRSKRSFPTIKDAEKISVSRASSHELFVEVKEPESHLEWEFEVKSGDIRFGILYKDRDGKKIEAVPPEKINTCEYTRTGLYKCENAGTCKYSP